MVIFYQGTVDHARYIDDVPPVALEYGNKTFGEHWIYQQDGAKPHIHHLTQKRCLDNFPSSIDKDHCALNSPDLNPLDYCILGRVCGGYRLALANIERRSHQRIETSSKKIEKMLLFNLVQLGLLI